MEAKMDKAGCVHGGILPAARHLHHACGKINRIPMAACSLPWAGGLL
ncbi:hypothetical protein DLM_0839 [Aquitalea magnusonii]|uniref:Uncharacterized protein n=1 Tax=Aquitalea magnusonii TaxID=332411 RepID=A0A3G9GAG1_9NEIS|nr:hypothetical protein DLM_0839 [Aquitalea magnusonii]